MKTIVASLLVIVAVAFAALLCPDAVARGLGFDEERFLLPCVLAACLVGGGALCGGAWALGRRAWRLGRVCRRLPQDCRATATAEFLMVIPVVFVMFATLFAMAEIAHAQLVFRYAAFAALRAGAVADYTLRWPPQLKGLTIHNLANEDRERMKLAAAVALAGLDAPRADDKGAKLPSVKDFNIVDVAAQMRRTAPDYWEKDHGKDYFNERCRAAFQQLEFSTTDDKNAQYVAARLFDEDIGRFIYALLKQMFKLKWEQLKKWLEDRAGIIGQYLIKIIEPLIKPLIEKLCELISKLIDECIGKYIDEILKRIPNPLAPPLLKLEMGYRPPLLPGSLFKILFTKQMVLRRVNGQGELPWRPKSERNPTAAAIYSSGGRIDIPLSLIKLFTKGANILPGDCSQ